MVWRYQWDRDKNDEHRQLLLTYNEEDCRALYILTNELSKVIETAESKQNVDFADQPKKHATDIGNRIHEELAQILQSAYLNYDKKKISIESMEKLLAGEKASFKRLPADLVIRRSTSAPPG